MSDNNPDYCKARVFDGWHDHGCSRAATRDGYCGIHHPDSVAKRRAKAEARDAEKRAAWRANFRGKQLADLAPELADALHEAMPLTTGELTARIGGLLDRYAAIIADVS